MLLVKSSLRFWVALAGAAMALRPLGSSIALLVVSMFLDFLIDLVKELIVVSCVTRIVWSSFWGM